MAAPELLEGPYGAPAGQPCSEGGQAPEPATINTLPFGKSGTWIGLIGVRFGSVLHCPCTFAWAISAVGTSVPSRSSARKRARQEILLSFDMLSCFACESPGPSFVKMKPKMKPPTSLTTITAKWPQLLNQWL